ncbi:MAG TPA: magnesium-translocating P-type ATPase [Parafilimonas sp.]|nr:magnesium-translocating P-type ATPase [Parafilimonas sp.]
MESFWTHTKAELFQRLNTSKDGLTETVARNRQLLCADKERFKKPWVKDLLLLLSQYKNPLILLLVFAVILSTVLGEYSESIIILVFLLLTGILGFFQERNASKAVEKLRQLVHNKSTVKRNGIEKDILIDEVVPGDIILLNAGDIIPADAYILESNDLHINESVLTGESFPAEKFAGECSLTASLSAVTNAVFKGTSVINGNATVLAVNTGAETILGKIGYSLQKEEIPSAFEKGIIRFGYLLMYLTIIISVAILIVNLTLNKPLFESILFALALAVGLAPELLPAIITITLSEGAKRMAGKKAIVKKLSAIQNLGEVDVLCSDKTGTITEGIVKVNAAVDSTGQPSNKVLLYALLNASFQTCFSNPIDEAIKAACSADISMYKKIDEVPYDFKRKRLSIVVAENNRHVMITKGAVDNVLEVCSAAANQDNARITLTNDLKTSIQKQYESFSQQGYRTIAVCYKDVSDNPIINKDDEKGLVFLGFLLLSDSPKKGIIESINRLRGTGIALKIITGDNGLVAKHLALQIGLNAEKIITGKDLATMTDDVLRMHIKQVDVFAEVVPEQKERIVKAFQQTGHVVGYMGDGINDANALQSADVGISIDNAVDIAKEAADLVLLDQNIDVIREGVEEGRKTFMNTMKYIYITTSANFGNMISMAVASLLLPFLPLLPVQILLNNFLSDLPAISIASDNVDKELVMNPRKWDIKYIRSFMIVFGLQSSLFDFITFGILYSYFHTQPQIFRTGWFMESLLSEILILLVLRTRHLFFKSKPSKYLLSSSLFTLLICLIIPYLPFAKGFQLYPLPVNIFLSLIAVTTGYIVFAETTKRFVMKRL